MIDEAAIRLRWDVVGSRLDERGRRLFAAAEVRTAGRGGLAMVSKITGLARSTINRGKQDLDTQPLPKGRVRRAGGGRRSVCENDPGLIPALKRLIEPATLGDPTGPTTTRHLCRHHRSVPLNRKRASPSSCTSFAICMRGAATSPGHDTTALKKRSWLWCRCRSPATNCTN